MFNHLDNPFNSEMLDSRDLIAFIEGMQEALYDSFIAFLEDLKGDDFEECDKETFLSILEERKDGSVPSDYEVEITSDDFQEWCDEAGSDLEEYEEIKDFAYVLENYSEYEYGMTIISEGYFEEYCEELCKDVGFISDNIPSFIEIDWTATSENMAVDYSQEECSYNNTNYYFRS